MEKGAINDEAEVITKSGKIKPVHITATVTSFGEKQIIQGIFHDITDRKRAEEALRESEGKYRTLFEESRDAIYITTRDGGFIDINQSGLDLFGYTREDIIGLNALKLYVDPEDRHRFQQEIEQKGSVRDYEVKFRKKAGTEIICLLTSTLWRTSDGSILGYHGIIRDITENRKIEEELFKIEKLESIGILAGGIAHDFNNILTAILGNIALATIHIKPGDEIFERLIAAEKACLQGKNLTRQLLTFSKGGAPVKKTVSITELIRDSVNFSLRGSDARCEFSISDDLWPVEVDEGQINQVISNLIINADHAMPEGGIIKVRAENMTVAARQYPPLKDGRYVKISIEDQGVGIPKENLQKIFDPFFTTKQDGSGLGLATTYSIIKNHGGYITVESDLGAGTTFHIYLQASHKRIPKKKAAEEKPLVGKGRILLMDDEEMVRNVAGKMLGHIGYEVEFAGDGDKAIELYKEAKESGHPFDAVIMDMTIPGGIGGKEAIKKLLEIDPDVKAIVSSGYFSDPIMSEFKRYGFRNVLAKPYRIKELTETLRKVITEVGK